MGVYKGVRCNHAKQILDVIGLVFMQRRIILATYIKTDRPLSLFQYKSRWRFLDEKSLALWTRFFGTRDTPATWGYLDGKKYKNFEGCEKEELDNLWERA